MNEKKEFKKAIVAQRDALKLFTTACLKKLELRGKKKIETGTLSDSVRSQQGPLLGQPKDHQIWFYFKRLKGELGELAGSLQRHEIYSNEKSCQAVINECCDVANFAAAIAEKAVEDTR